MVRKTGRAVDNIVVRRMADLIKERGKKEVDLTDHLGLSPGSMTRWRYGGSYVYTKYIYEICEYLDTTPNYLFFGSEDDEERLSPRERDLIRTYRCLDGGRQKCIRDTAEYFKKGCWGSRKKK